MNDLREQIAKIIYNDTMIDQDSWVTQHEADTCADTILALIPKPTVRVKCGECGRIDYQDKNRNVMTNDEIINSHKPCSCTDGWNNHLITWRHPADHEGATGFDVILTLPDLIDPDMRDALTYLNNLVGVQQRFPLIVPKLEMEIDNNKGTLRIGEKV